MDIQGMREQIIANVLVVQKINKMYLVNNWATAVALESDWAEAAGFEPKRDRLEVVVVPNGDRFLEVGSSANVSLISAVVSCDSGSILVQGQPKQGPLASLDSLLLATVEMLRSYSNKTGLATLLTPDNLYAVEQTEHGLHSRLTVN